MAVLQWITANEKTILRSMVVLLAASILYFVWARFHPARPMTFESQQQASTPAGVQLTANNAQVPLSASQAARVVQSVQASANVVPVAIVATTGSKLQEAVKAELQKFGGQFSIVTDPAHPGSAPVVAAAAAKPASANAEVIPPTAAVTLNQYNIKAYPDRLIQIGGSYQEVFAAYKLAGLNSEDSAAGSARRRRLHGRLYSC